MLDAQNVKDTMDYILPWLVEAETDWLNMGKPAADSGTVSVQSDKHKADNQQLLSHAHLIDSLRTQPTESLAEDEVELLEEILARWDRCCELSEERKEVLEVATDHLYQLEKASADLNNFINHMETDIMENNAVPLNDISVVEDMIGKHKVNYRTIHSLIIELNRFHVLIL